MGVPANETSRIELLERDVHVLLMENWRLTEELEKANNHVEVLSKQAYAKDRKITALLKRAAKQQEPVKPIQTDDIEKQITAYRKKKNEKSMAPTNKN